MQVNTSMIGGSHTVMGARSHICVLRATLANDNWKEMAAISIFVEVSKGGRHAIPQIRPSEPASALIIGATT